MAKQKKIKINVGLANITEAGFDKFLRRDYGGQFNGMSRYITAQNFSGGELGGNTVISLGNGLIKIDGRNKRITISDGQYDRVLIGYQQGGF